MVLYGVFNFFGVHLAEYNCPPCVQDAHKLVLGFKCGQCGYKTANKDLYHDHMKSHESAAQSSQDLVNKNANDAVISEAVTLNDGIITIQE